VWLGLWWGLLCSVFVGFAGEVFVGLVFVRSAFFILVGAVGLVVVRCLGLLHVA